MVRDLTNRELSGSCPINTPCSSSKESARQRASHGSRTLTLVRTEVPWNQGRGTLFIPRTLPLERSTACRVPARMRHRRLQRGRPSHFRLSRQRERMAGERTRWSVRRGVPQRRPVFRFRHLFFSCSTHRLLRPRWSTAHGGLPERRSLLALRAAAAARSDRLLGKLQAILEVYGARSTRASAPVSSEASDAACSPGTATQDGW